MSGLRTWFGARVWVLLTHTHTEKQKVKLGLVGKTGACPSDGIKLAAHFYEGCSAVMNPNNAWDPRCDLSPSDATTAVTLLRIYKTKGRIRLR